MTKIIRNLQHDIKTLHQFQKSHSLMMVITIPSILSFFSAMVYFINREQMIGLVYVCMTLSVLGIVGGGFIIYSEDKKIKIIEKIIKDAKSIISGKQDIEEILVFTKNIYKVITSKEMLDWYQTLLGYQKDLKTIGSIGESFIKLSLELLIDLKNDLLLNTENQTKSLKSAKSEVESNIKGTTELDQVSELQKIRLDKQIEQFEELQKVLVKV